MKMIESRNETVHSYNIETIEGVLALINDKYLDAFEAFEDKMSGIAEMADRDGTL